MSFQARELHYKNAAGDEGQQWGVFKRDMIVCVIPRNFLGGQQLAERIAILLEDSQGIDLNEMKKGELKNLFNAMWALTGRRMERRTHRDDDPDDAQDRRAGT